MVDVRSLIPGFFILSIIVLLTLWVNSLISSSIVELDFTPQRTGTTVSTPSQSAVSATNTVAYESIISNTPNVFSNRSYSWRGPKTEEVQNMRALIGGELSEYSNKYLEDIGLRKIILVDDIQTRDNQPVLGFSDPLRGEIYLNTVELEGEFSRSVVAEQTIHHELAHLLAYSEYGYWFNRDSGWQGLSGDYSYGEVTRASKEYFPRDGFVSRYSMSSPDEDFAEVYSLLYTEYFKSSLSEEAEVSELLRSKVQFVYETILAVDPAQCRQSYQVAWLTCD